MKPGLPHRAAANRRAFAGFLPLAFFLFSAGPAAASWSPSLATTATWDGNATNSDRSSDIISALQLRAELGATQRVSLGRDDALFLGAQLGTEAWPRFDGLDRIAFGPQLAWQHKFGLGAFAPRFSVELAGDAVAGRESDRSGLAGRVAFSWRQRLNPGTQVALTYERARHDARAFVFDRTGEEAAFEVTRDIDDHWALTLRARWREGDVLSYATPPRPDLVSLAKERVTVNTFDQPRVAYSLDARTLGGSVAASRTLTDTTALTLSYVFRHTTRGPLSYVNHLVSVTLDRQF